MGTDWSLKSSSFSFIHTLVSVHGGWGEGRQASNWGISPLTTAGYALINECMYHYSIMVSYWKCGKMFCMQWHKRQGGRGQRGRVPPETYDWEIFADLYWEKRGKEKRGKEREEKKGEKRGKEKRKNGPDKEGKVEN